MTDSIAAAKLALYIILAQPAIYCLFKHGKTGFIGWLYVQIFCVLRIVTGGIGLHDAGSSTGTVILNSIGLSPLLLAASGILHEARRATNPRLNRRFDVVLEVQYHALVGAAMALIIVSVINLQKGKDVSHNETLLKVASALIALAWFLLAVWSLWSLSKTRSSSNSPVPSHRGGMLLLYAVFITLPLLGLRLSYAIAFLQLQISDPSSGFLSSKAIEVCLGLIPELLVTVIFIGVGVKTRDIKHDIKKLDFFKPVDNSREFRARTTQA
jgi:NADH:ubiquinone oxidoreductase subunit 6 (subunit J)